MNHEPQREILDPERAKLDSKDLIETACPLLRELVNLGTYAARIALECPRQEELPAFPLMASFLHVVELADALEVLIQESCAWAGAPLCRSMFEALLAFEYIAGSEATPRAAAWWVGTMHARVDYIRRIDPRTAQGQDFLIQVSADKSLAGWGIMPVEHIDRFNSSVEDFVKRDEYVEAEAEYQRLSTERRGRLVPWYALFGGPTTIRDLARYVKRGAQYEVLYRQWSQIVHPENLTRWILTNTAGPPAVNRLRDPKVLHDIAFYTANFVAEGIADLMEWFAADRLHEAVPGPAYVALYERLRAWSKPGI